MGVLVAVGVAVGVTVGVRVDVRVAVGVRVGVPVGVTVEVGVAVPVGVGVRVGPQATSNATEKIAARSPLSASEAQNCQVPPGLWPTKPEKLAKVEACPSGFGANRQIPFCWQTTWAPVSPAPIASALACPASVKVTG